MIITKYIISCIPYITQQSIPQSEANIYIEFMAIAHCCSTVNKLINVLKSKKHNSNDNNDSNNTTCHTHM